MLPAQPTDPAAQQRTTGAVRESLAQCLKTDAEGRTKLTVTLPERVK